MKRLLFLLLPLLVSCGRGSQTTATTAALVPADVGWMVLTRDIQTARNYTGIWIRVRLQHTEYEAGVREIRVWADGKGRPPILVFRLDGEVVIPERARLVITGKCAGPQVDGVTRKRGADYCVYVDACSVTALPGP